MDKPFKSFKKSGTYHRKLKRINEKYRLMYRSLQLKHKTVEKSATLAAPKIVPDCAKGRNQPDDTSIPYQNKKQNCKPSQSSIATALSNPTAVYPDTQRVNLHTLDLVQAGPTEVLNDIESKQQHDLKGQNYTSMRSQTESSREALRSWSLRYNIHHNALKDLLGLIKEKYNDTTLPMDPRTLLETPLNIRKLCTKIPGGTYWHHGLAACLETWFANLSADISINININIDGLPVHKSSKFQLWPILCNVHNMPELKPMPIGIFLGKTKPTDIDQYLTPFVNEAVPLLQNGFHFKGHIIRINIRCFICDSPARALIKGVINFNGKDGCMKCIVLGEYSYVSRTVVFPKLHCPLRTDLKFRQKQYGKHHSGQDSPILKLPKFDMVQDFVVADSLHLLELGVMKRLLSGWRDGSLGYEGKLPAIKIQKLSDYLVKIKLPKEIHRQMRGLDCLAFWKGTEWHSFLNYVGIVVLKDIIDEKLYNHFLLLFIAVRLCSTEYFRKWLPLAQTLFEKFIEGFIEIYGEEFITSNIHNLEHVVNDVERFGNLNTISAYPFESYLFQLKKCVRQGNNCLEQVANRIVEKKHVPKESDDTNTFFPTVTKRGGLVKCEVRSGLELNNGFKDSWFLTKKFEIVQMCDASVNPNNSILIRGKVLTNQSDFFNLPIRSSFLYIYFAHMANFKCVQSFKIDDIVCKFVAIPYKTDHSVYVPLLHTFNC